MSRFREYMRERAESKMGMADAAIALGVPVFACAADKRPITSHGFKDATTDAAELRRQFGDSRAVMIGMPTGEATGFVVVDVDMKPGQQGGAWLDANSHRMPHTRTIRTATGGLHLWFKHPGGRVKNSASKIAPNVDVRGDGGYVIVPPSPGYAVADNAEPAEVPDWLLPAICPPEAAPASPAPSMPRRVALGPADGSTALGRAALAERCEEIRTAADGAKHETLNTAAYAIGGLVAAGELIEGEALGELRAALGAILHRCKDQRHAEKTLARAFADGMGKPQSPPAMVVTPPDEVNPATPYLNRIARGEIKPRKPLPVAAGLMDVPGALGEFVAYCEATAISPQPFLALAAGITLIGTLAGRRYETNTELRTNIYAIGIADSGAGKDHARKQIRRCLYAANLTQYLGGSDVASGAALRTALVRHPATLFQIDEFGDWLRDVLGDKAATHKKQIAAYLKELYSSANIPWSGTEYADQSRQGKPREDIHSPHACLYGTTTPAQFWAAVAGGSLHDGLMARMLIFVSPESYPDEREAAMGPPPDSLIQALQAIAAGVEGGGNLGGLMSAAITPSPYRVPETAKATAMRQALRRAQLEQQREAAGTYVTAIAARLTENAMKLALIRAVSRAPAAPVIDEGDVSWGREVAQHCMDTLCQEAGRHVADSDFERKMNLAREIIRKHGPVTESEMMRRGFKLPEKDRREVIKALLTEKAIVTLEVNPTAAGGRPTVRYSIAAAT
jgi:hypothetical protein